MKLLRGVGAIVTFLIGLFTIVGGLFGMASAWAYAAQTHQPVDLAWLAEGLIATAIGCCSCSSPGGWTPNTGRFAAIAAVPESPERTHDSGADEEPCAHPATDVLSVTSHRWLSER